MDFFTRFEEARDEFTYDDEEQPGKPVIQVGLAATFFLENAWNRRPAILALMDRYLARYGDHLTWLTFGDPVRQKPLTPENLDRLRHYVLDEAPYNGAEFHLSSLDIKHVGDYEYSAYSQADWLERVHGVLAHVRYYLPIEVLRADGREMFESFLHEACELLRPLHAQAGLAIQECYAHEDYQHVEYEVAEAFLGLDVAAPIIGTKLLRTGFKTVNWYTILADPLLARVGGAEGLPDRLADARIAVLPYAGGAMIRAGEWPELGWVKRDPQPELYVKVNRVLRPARAEKIELAYGSVFGETRFTPRTADLWLRRFDVPDDETRDTAPVTESGGPRLVLLTAYPGEACPETGEWYSVNWSGRRASLQKGDPMPGPKFSDTGQVIWHLKR